MDECDIGIVVGQLLQSRRVHSWVLRPSLHGAEIPRLLQVQVVQVDRRPLQSTGQNTDDPGGFRFAEKGEKMENKQHSRVVLQALNDFQALGSLPACAERGVARGQEQ